MKHSLLTILFGMMTITGFAQSTGEIMYVYRNDGEVNTFLRSEVQEFSFSRVDTDGNEYEDIVSQLIATADSTYYIPLAAIDSIGFVTPATVLQPGVSDLAPTLASYVVEAGEQMLILSGSTPESLLPVVGSRVVLAEYGFAGDISSVTKQDGNYVVEAKLMDLDQIFDTYYAVNITDFDQDGSARTRAKTGNKNATLPTFKMELTSELIEDLVPGDDFAMPGDTKFTATVTPVFSVKTSLVINKKQGVKGSANIIGDFDCAEQLAYSGKLASYSKDFNLPKDLVDIPIGETFFFFYNRWGLFFKASAEVTFDLKWQQHYRSTFNWNYDSKAKSQQMPTTSFRCTSEKFTPEGCLKGTMSGGVFTEIGVKFVTTDLAKAALRVEAGYELEGDFIFRNSDIDKASKSTVIYEKLKASKIDLNEVVSGTIDLSFLDTEQSFDLPWKHNRNLKSWYLVPEFVNTSLIQKHGGSSSAIGSVSTTKREMLLPLELGLRLFDGDGQMVSDWKSPNKYNKDNTTIEHQFDDLDAEKEYKVQPTVKFLFIDLLANPEADIERSEFPVRIVSFEQTGSHYSKQQGYEYDGRKYFYKFNAKTTVELSDAAENVKDWGYVYHDFYGEDKKISCANLGGRTYADERYAYYYNDPQRTVELSPYVQFNGETEIQVGKKKTYEVSHSHDSSSSCPDNNHPHAIDLGLPSSTLWACCNVGASDPEDRGEHYAWGMTTNVVGEKYPLGKSLWYTDIAGSEYDVAREKWGGAWSMPTKEQMQELLDCCSAESVVLGGYENGGGIRFTGPNGNSILLIGAGMLNEVGTEDGLDDDDKPIKIKYFDGPDEGYTWKPGPDVRYHYDGHYWTSTDSYGLEFNAYYWFGWRYTDDTYTTLNNYEMYSSYFDLPNFTLGNIYYKNSGHRLSVRPVMKK